MSLLGRLFTRRNRINPELKQIAKDYVSAIKKLRADLKAKRAEYREAVQRDEANPDLDTIKNEFRAIARTWPRFTGNVRVQDDPTALPYPENNVIERIGVRDKINIVKTSFLVEREINVRSRVNVSMAALDMMQPGVVNFKRYLRKNLSPPVYPFQYDEDEDEDEDWEGEGEGEGYTRNSRSRYGIVPASAPVYGELPIQQVTRRRSRSRSRSPPPNYRITAGGYKKKKNKTRRCKRRN